MSSDRVEMVLLNPYLHFSDVTKEYSTPKGSVAVVEGFDFRVACGEFISIIGHSGCGKSTVLMIAAGLNQASRGGVILENKLIDEPGTDRGVVFQNPSLFPWMTTLENVLLGVRQVRPKDSKEQCVQIAQHYLATVGLGDCLDQRASELSIGMKQRVSIARAFALKPKLLLLDEPFGMLDSLTRAELQDVLLEIWYAEKITAVMVTHDVDEALYLSDRIVMMTSGPHAKVGDVMETGFARPRRKEEVIEHPEYYLKRGVLIDFLERGHHMEKPDALARLALSGTMTFPKGATTPQTNHTGGTS